MLWWTLRQLRSTDPAVRLRAFRKLADSGDLRAVAPLVVVPRDSGSPMMRENAALALGHIGDARAVEPLVAALQDKDWGVRQAAMWALGQLGDARAVEPLVAALQDERWGVRAAAVQALTALGWQPVNDQQRALHAIARGGWEDVVRLGAVAVEPLLAALRDGNWHVQQAATRALGQLGDTRAVEPLVAALGYEDAGVRQAAAQALGQLGDARAVGWLVGRVRYDEDSAVASIMTLQRILECAAAKLASKELRTIADLPGVVKLQFRHGFCGVNKEMSVDCSHVKQLARQELIRRGLEA